MPRKSRTFLGAPCVRCGGHERYRLSKGCLRCARHHSELQHIRRQFGRMLDPADRADPFRGPALNGGRPPRCN